MQFLLREYHKHWSLFMMEKGLCHPEQSRAATAILQDQNLQCLLSYCLNLPC